MKSRGPPARLATYRYLTGISLPTFLGDEIIILYRVLVVSRCNFLSCSLQMFGNGTDLCENSWGSSFAVSTSPCRCLDMTEIDAKVITYILEGEHSEESGEEQACKPRLQDPSGKKGPDGDDEDD